LDNRPDDFGGEAGGEEEEEEEREIIERDRMDREKGGALMAARR
jgi:hypothetical protein